MIKVVTYLQKKMGRMKRHILRTAIVLSVVLATFMAVQPGTAASAEPKPLTIQVLFLQNAEAVVFGKGTLTLKDVSPMTVFFSDRPVRIAEHFNTKDEFVPLWDEGKDSFLKDPPNATVSMYEKVREQLTDLVVKLSRPRFAGKDLTYDIAVIEGKLPEKGGACSVFIDISDFHLHPSPLPALRDGRHFER